MGKLAEIDNPRAEGIIDILQEHGITVCDCISFLTRQKKEKALRQVPWLTGEDRTYFSAIPQPAENPGKVTCDATIDPELCDFVRQMYQREKPLTVSSTLSPELAGHKHHPDLAGRASEFSEQSQIFINLERELGPAEARAILAHEVTHLERGHSITGKIMNDTIEQYNESLTFGLKVALYRLKLLKTNPGQQGTAQYIGWVRSNEAEANRIPAACNCLRTAHDLKKFHQSCFNEIRKYDHCSPQDKAANCERFNLDYVPKTSDEYERATDPVHPTSSKEYQWAATILRLREIEEQRRTASAQQAAQAARFAAAEAALAQTVRQAVPQQSVQRQQQRFQPQVVDHTERRLGAFSAF